MSDAKKLTQDFREEQQGNVQRVTRKRLIDSLNYVNFQKKSIIINLEHNQYACPLSLRADPQPCSGLTLYCTWAESCPPDITTSYTFRNFMVDRGLDLIMAEAQATEITDEGITFVLPGDCKSFRTREARRYSAREVKVTLLQDSRSVSGILDDFTALSFRVLLRNDEGYPHSRINEKTPVYAIFQCSDTVLYTGECRLTRQVKSQREEALVFEHLYSQNIELRQRRFKSDGHMLIPQPGITFIHPLSKKRIGLKADEISSCWFSVLENYENSVLFSGLVIPDVELELAPGFYVSCEAQVGYGGLCEGEGERTIKWWVLILDMGIEDQSRLFSLLQRSSNHKSAACSKVDPDDLLTFFFNSGLVYAQKYASIQTDKETIRETYRKLYLDNQTIARHFMQVDRGTIQAHLSMIRFYENTWILHHHAALGQHAAGLAVLNQVRDYVHDYRHMHSSHMDYLICYFRPNNKFPNRIFGGFCRSLDDPRLCSLDSFAYLTIFFSRYGKRGQDDCKFEPATRNDINELSRFYNYISNGLLLEALGIGPDMTDEKGISEEYRKLGLKREKHLYALKRGGRLKAVALVLVSDAGLNLSNLTNCIHVFVVNDEALPPDQLCSHLAGLSHHYPKDDIPLLVYPLTYMTDTSFLYEKVYQLWAFDTRHTDRFYSYMAGIVPRKKGVDKTEEYQGVAGCGSEP